LRLERHAALATEVYAAVHDRRSPEAHQRQVGDGVTTAASTRTVREVGLGPVQYTSTLVGFVAAIVLAAVAVAVVTLRPPTDVATVVIGGVAILLMAARGSSAPYRWSLSGLVILGLTLSAGPVGALVAALAEALGVALRTRNGWFRSAFNVANQFLANSSAWAVFSGIEMLLGRGAPTLLLGAVAAGLAQSIVKDVLVTAVVHCATPNVPLARLAEARLKVMPMVPVSSLAGFCFLVMHNDAGWLGFATLLVPCLFLHEVVLNFRHRESALEEERGNHRQRQQALLQEMLQAKRTDGEGAEGA